MILIGEIRDAETAQIAVQSALTGHLVMASLHAADAVGALYRFLDMGLEGYLVASAVIGVVAQRLVRINCDQCSRANGIRPEEAEFYHAVRGRSPKVKQQVGTGCRKCNGTGYFERRGVFECVGVDDTIRELVDPAGAADRAARATSAPAGTRSLQDAACDMVDEGKTTSPRRCAPSTCSEEDQPCSGQRRPASPTPRQERVPAVLAGVLHVQPVGKVKPQVSILFCRQLSSFVRVGVPVTTAIETFAEQATNVKLRDAYRRWRPTSSEGCASATLSPPIRGCSRASSPTWSGPPR